VCEHGFGQISLGLNRITESIQQLIRIAQTPDQTWALEQFSISQDAFRRNLFEESLDYINRAISGFGPKPGYRLEHRFYMMRGLIRLGNYRNFDAGIVNLEEAVDDFLLGAKYAEHDHHQDCARSLGLAGWAAYCIGRMEDAERYLRMSVDKNPSDFQSAFDYAKVCLHRDNKDQGLEYFDKALRADFKYGLRAGADEDFLRWKDEVRRVIRRYGAELQRDIDSCLSRFQQLDLASKRPILASHSLGIDESAIAFFRSIPADLAQVPIADLVRLKSEAPNHLSRLEDSLNRARDYLRSRARELRATRDPAFDEFSPKADIYFAVSGLAAYALLILNVIEEDALTIIGTAVFGLLGAVLAGKFGEYIIFPAVHLIANLKNKQNRGVTAAALEADAERL
ncbi:MAG: hypothetical protein KDI37_08850, partial [Xanthomonadales bacterium]|nr:hypothetical protein [Xanthomonadales bacterium]